MTRIEPLERVASTNVVYYARCITPYVDNAPPERYEHLVCGTRLDLHASLSSLQYHLRRWGVARPVHASNPMVDLPGDYY